MSVRANDPDGDQMEASNAKHECLLSENMAMSLKPYSTLVDFITGEEVPDVGAEENRQAVERFLVESKGYMKEDIAVDVDIVLDIRGNAYRSQVDLTISADGGKTTAMAIKCCAGSPASREREILSAARLLKDYQVPFAVVSDGSTAIVLYTVSGAPLGRGLEAIPSKADLAEHMKSAPLEPLSPARREKEKLIFRTYDSDNVNVKRNL